MTKVIDPITVDSVATHARASTATWWDYLGVLQTAAINTLRFNWNRFGNVFEGVLLEPAATNLLLNSASPSTQTRTVSNGAVYTVSFYGAGTITLSGATARAIVGTGSTVLTEYSFTTASTSLTLTISGSVQYGQLETGSHATSRIVTTGSAVTRAADVITGSGVIYSAFTDATPTYNPATAYDLGDVVQYDGRLYESMVAGTDTNTGNTPGVALSTVWLDTGPNNTFAMFDRQVGTASLGTAAEQYVCIALPSSADAITVFNLADATSIHLIISDGYTHFSSVYESGLPTNAVLSGATAGGIVTIAVNNATAGPPTPPNPSIGELVVGVLQTVGEEQFGIGLSLVDYSRKTTDEFGVTTFVERAFSKRLSFELLIAKADFNTTLDLLLSLRAQPSAWIITDDESYSSAALAYAFIIDLRAVINYPTVSLFSLELTTLI